mgnify:FL=1
MTKEQEKFFIIDERTQTAMKRNPESEFQELKEEAKKEDFKIICLDDTQNKELFSGDKAEPIGDYQGIVIKSDLYLNDKSYFPLGYYSQSYFVQLNMLMKRIASYMGACKWEFSFIEEISHLQEQGDDDGASASAESKSWTEGKGVNQTRHGFDFGVGFGYNYANTSLNSTAAKFEYQHSEEFVGRKKSPQELAKFIEEQGINLNAFDPSFKEQVQDYIKGETISTTSQMVDKSERIIKHNKTIKKISANVKLFKIFELKFQRNLREELKTEHKQRVKLLYRMTFDDKKSHSKT